jgi:MFS family permease
LNERISIMAEIELDNSKAEQQIPDHVDQTDSSLGNDYVSGVPLFLSLLATGLATVLIGYVSSFPFTTRSLRPYAYNIQDANCVTTIIPLVTDTFDSLSDVGWYGSSFLLASAASQLFYGKIYRFWSTRIVFSVVVLIFAVGNLICALSRSSAVFTIGRAISGLGSAGVLSGTFITVSRAAPVQRRPVYLGIIRALESSAIAVGPLLGGLIADTLGWRWCFWLCLPLAGITILVTMIFLRSNDSTEEVNVSFSAKLKQLDLASMAIFVPSIVCFILALQWGGSRYPWSSWRIILLFVIFFCLMVAFAGLQWRNGDDATVPPKVFLTRTVCFGALYSFNTSGSLSVILYYVSHHHSLQR